MPGRKRQDDIWIYVIIHNFKKRSWSCRFCSSCFHGGIEKVQAHLAGIPKKGIEVCNAVVPDDVVQKCKSSFENRRTKRPKAIQHACSTLTSTPNPGGFQDESNIEAQPVLQSHHESGDGTTHVAESGFEAEPVEQPQDGNGDGMTQAAGLAATSRADEMSSCTYTALQDINFEPSNSDGFVGCDASVTSTSRASPGIFQEISEMLNSDSLWDSQWEHDASAASISREMSLPFSPNADRKFQEETNLLRNFDCSMDYDVSGFLDFQASGGGSTNALQVDVSQDSEGLKNALDSLVEKGYLRGEHTYLLQGFLTTRPAMRLPDNGDPSYVGTAYTRLAELLTFVDTYKPSDTSEASVNNFTRLMGKVRIYKFDTEWLNSLEKRVNSKLENAKALRQTFDDCCREEKDGRLKQQKLTAEFADIQKRLEELNINLATIQERKMNVHEAINELERPIGFRD